MPNNLKNFLHFSRSLTNSCLRFGCRQEDMSAGETLLLNLFDSYWFEHKIFTPKTPLEANLLLLLDHHEAQEQEQEQKYQEPPKLARITTLMTKSYSDQDLNSKDTLNPSNSPSPTSVLDGPKLQTILSGKEVGIFKEEENEEMKKKTDRNYRETLPSRRTRRRRKSISRSLSELEFEELKGFMDLGFVFSDDEVDSRLVKIVPGLQRLGKTEGFGGEGSCSSSVSRPYLSEAWDCLEDDEKKVKNPLMDWRIPAFGNEMELKHHLRSWAHTVASAVV